MTISDRTFNEDHETNYHIMMGRGLVGERLYYEKSRSIRIVQ